MIVAMSYFLGNRPIERILAFLLTLAAVVWFGVSHQTALSETSFIGLICGIVACFFTRTLGVSAMTEGTLWMVVTILIGIKYGIKAAGMSVLAWLLLSLVMVLVINLVNRIFWRQHPKV
jgi:hypothetical protein